MASRGSALASTVALVTRAVVGIGAEIRRSFRVEGGTVVPTAITPPPDGDAAFALAAYTFAWALFSREQS